MKRTSPDILLGSNVQKAAADAWWKQAQALGEEAYVVRHALDYYPGSWRLMLKIISKRYPQHLPKLYREAIAESTGGSVLALADAVAASKLSAAEKREIFLKVAAAEDLDHRVDALTYLKELDPIAFHRILIASLDRLPKVPPEGVVPKGFTGTVGYSLTHYERLTALVSHTTENSAWDALRGATQRADVGFRIFLLSTVTPGDHKEPIRSRQLRLLMGFLNDATVRDMSKDYSHGMHHEFKQLEVRNYAAWQIAQSLGMDDDPEPEWTDAQWAELRANVKVALAKAGIK